MATSTLSRRPLLDRLVDRIGRRLAGPAVRFTDPGTNADHGVPVPPVDPASPPSGVPEANFTTRPGAGRRANECLFLDEAGHICEDWHGNPTNRMCRASNYKESVDEFDRRHPNFFGDRAGIPQTPPPPMACCGGFPGEHFAGCHTEGAVA